MLSAPPFRSQPPACYPTKLPHTGRLWAQLYNTIVTGATGGVTPPQGTGGRGVSRVTPPQGGVTPPQRGGGRVKPPRTISCAPPFPGMNRMGSAGGALGSVPAYSPCEARGCRAVVCVRVNRRCSALLLHLAPVAFAGVQSCNGAAVRSAVRRPRTQLPAQVPRLVGWHAGAALQSAKHPTDFISWTILCAAGWGCLPGPWLLSPV